MQDVLRQLANTSKLLASVRDKLIEAKAPGAVLFSLELSTHACIEAHYWLDRAVKWRDKK